VPCLVRFVRNDLLLRDPLEQYLKVATKNFEGGQWCYYRKVKTYGYGETSETVVKIYLIIVPNDVVSNNDAVRKSSRGALKISGLDDVFQRRVTVSADGQKTVSTDYIGDAADDETASVRSQGYETAEEGNRSEMTECSDSARGSKE